MSGPESEQAVEAAAAAIIAQQRRAARICEMLQGSEVRVIRSPVSAILSPHNRNVPGIWSVCTRVGEILIHRERFLSHATGRESWAVHPEIVSDESSEWIRSHRLDQARAGSRRELVQIIRAALAVDAAAVASGD